MLQNPSGIGFQSTLLSQLGGVIHGFSNRSAGDMKYSSENRDLFAHKLGFKTSPVLAQQVHDNLIRTVDSQTMGIVPGVDGLVSRDVTVAVVVADCVPVLLVDPIGKVIAAVHAGWKGTVGSVVGNAVGEMVRMGGDVRRIYAAIGAHIGGCCYDVPVERVDVFVNRFGHDEKMAFQSDGKWHLDIGWLNYRQLIEAGVLQDNIDAPPTCTSCQNDEFFSYRKDTKETYGEMMAVIGFK
ncbi:hypothetical protein A2973_03715 [Candidatus Gottesmanbacteria bacterium RIFCSPLOWO2_01_FULL_49_10]|uniref:Purine nucleoside phosphorylase n=1 Tax=Candidatus Gottesmanbacteria bacterium RIFCSPLOWO2_01_FULL_49_10 TaxID=1798396 RepID=A0A1F6B1W7_9BACT|nr:MAG: hypothetical protein A2973_03715 [Candidatus Gottesmanbacteria bacterium RIFCSPLOWO2_01_FULL_49_10]